MPIYEYRCKKCGQEFELLVSASTTDVSCPECSSPKVTRKFSPFAVGTSSRAPSRESASGPRSSGHSCSSCGGGHCATCH
jgi:putative FmdB family regulatory protein